jgi:type VI secretion system protein ImpG
VFVTLVDAAEAPYPPELTSLVAQCLCTNRGLSTTIRPREGTTDFELAAGGPVDSIRCADGLLSPPRPSYAHGDFGWRLVNHLTVNYLSLTAAEEAQSAAALRGLLSLYTHAADPDRDPKIQAVQHLRQRPKTHRMPTPGAALVRARDRSDRGAG